jgi:periplasmic copper chaperone A
MHRTVRTAFIGLLGILALTTGVTVAKGVQAPSASDAWVKLPAAGDTTASAFVSVDNPTMYDIYLASATADVAGKVEFRQADASGALKPDVVKNVTVPAYGSLELDAKGTRLVLSELKRPLKEGETVNLTLSILYGPTLQVPATVKKE